MQHLDGVYTQLLNRLINKDGVLFRGRYKACLIEAENYLIHTSKYIHLNPVAAKLVANPEDYQWSGYQYYVNLNLRPNWLSTTDTLQFFGEESQQQKYIRACCNYSANS